MSYVPVFGSPSFAAKAMLSQYWDGRLPVDPIAIAHRIGLTVRQLPDLSPYSGWFNAEAHVIEYQPTEARVRQRFTVAHELGHYALGHGTRARDTAMQFSSGTSDPAERAANQFAAELLMPADAVHSIVSSGQFRTVDELARVFDVSKVAMSYRMTNLGIGFFA